MICKATPGASARISDSEPYLEDLVFVGAARTSLRRHFPEIAVTCCYAASENAAVTFTDVTG